ncbi:hypothetical protein [Pseudomonas serbica]|uniref:hypothetical protein n=1 Tax=Pseudomonas serbica TaxID=2965074 RepID=UPI00237ADA3D|nr:hypothetical protein [Pseudomonas serbica]
MLDLALVDKLVFDRSLKRLTAMKGRLPDAIASFGDDLSVIQYVSSFDPTPDCIYTKWLMTRLHRNPEVLINELKNSAQGCNTVGNLLAEFHGVKQRLPLEQRDIFVYGSVHELEQALTPHRATRFNASKKFLKMLDLHECLLETQVMACDGLTVHKARCIEDVIVITGADNVFDGRGDGLYRSLLADGDVYVFNTGYGPLVGALPTKVGQRGDLFDCCGERAMFEDALPLHPNLSWDTAPELLSLMIKIDPSIPFDNEMTEKEPFLVALKQFPLILHEDREIPEDLLDEILADEEVGPTVREFLGDR